MRLFTPVAGVTVIRHFAARLRRRFVNFGTRYYCPCCRSRLRRFLPFGRPSRPNAMCPVCWSLERHRLIWLYVTEQLRRNTAALTLLHIAPERELGNLIRGHSRVTYVSGDLASDLAMVRLELTRLPFKTDAFNVVICSHVLEHVPDDRSAIREIGRVLRQSGWALLQSPIDDPRTQTYEDEAITSEHDRLAAFGQEDHVRMYGTDYGSRIRSQGLRVTKDPFARKLSPKLATRFGVDPQEDLWICSKESVNR